MKTIQRLLVCLAIATITTVSHAAFVITNSGSGFSTDNTSEGFASGFTSGSGGATIQITTTGGNTYYQTANWVPNDPGSPTRYVEFIVASGSAFQTITLNELTFDVRRSGSGPDTVRVSVFDASLTEVASTDFPLSGTAFNPKTMNLSALAESESFTFRFYGLGANNAGGTMDLDNIGVTGQGATVVPEPANVALAIFGLAAIGVTAGRRMLKRRTE